MKLALALLRPLSAIARELRALRELYELELAQRDPPIVRHTEQPADTDTEVTYDEFKDSRPKWKRWLEGT